MIFTYFGYFLQSFKDVLDIFLDKFVSNGSVLIFLIAIIVILPLIWYILGGFKNDELG